MKAKSEYAWKLCTAERLQVWPKDTSQFYLTSPTKFFPKEAVGLSGVHIPSGVFERILGKYGIEAAAFTSHRKSFYISRSEADKFTLAFCVSCARYRLNVVGRKIDLKEGMGFLVPPNTAFETSGTKMKAIWFEMKNSPFWRNAFGDSVVCRKAEYLDKISFLFSMYAEELLSKEASIPILQNIAKLLIETMRREFRATAVSEESAALKKLADKIESSLSEKWTLKSACEETGLVQNRLTSLFEKEYGCTFSKFLRRARMETAAELLREGSTLADIALKTGFSDAHAISYAFKSHYGYSPRSLPPLE